MIEISENISIFLLIFLTLISLITYFLLSFKRLKMQESKRLQTVFSEIEVEKKTRLSLQNTSIQIDKLEQQTKTSFLKIRVEIFNIDFSYREIFSNI